MPNALLSNEELTDAIDREHAAAGIINDLPTTFVNSLTEPFKNSIASVNNEVHQFYNRYILELAIGDDLNEKASEFGVSRSEGTYLSDDTYENFNVYIADGTASAYIVNQDLPLVIPSTAIRIRDIAGREYTLTDSITIQPTSFSGYAPFIANSYNVRNIAVGEINTCEIDYEAIDNLDPTKADTLVFGCRNNKAIVAETPTRTDAELRQAAYLRINSMNNTNEDALRLVLRRYGITDVTFKRNMYGFGSIGVVISLGGIVGQMSNSTITRLNNILANVCPTARVVVPEYMIIKFTFSLEVTDSTRLQETRNEIFSAVQGYFNTLSPGDSLSTTTIKDIVDEINNVSRFEIRCMMIDGRKCILGRQRALSDQLFVLSEDEPIRYAQ